MRVDLAGVAIDSYSFDQVIKQIAEQVSQRSRPEYVVTPNAQHVVLLQNNERFRQIYRQAFLVVPDGVSLLWAAQFIGTPLNGRVNGTDLFETLCAIAAEKQFRVFLMGGRPGAADRATQILTARYSGLEIVGTYCPPFGFEQDSIELDKITQAVKTARPDILFVGLGAPKQEYWIADHYQTLNVPVSLGIGVSFELVSGMVTRAPLWMQKMGLEWFFRLLMEPRRLWQRYLVGNVQFVFLMLRQRLGLLRSSAPSGS